jgi:hypothetical protein
MIATCAAQACDASHQRVRKNLTGLDSAAGTLDRIVQTPQTLHGLGINVSGRVLLFSTESATNPELCRMIIAEHSINNY